MKQLKQNENNILKSENLKSESSKLIKDNLNTENSSYLKKNVKKIDGNGKNCIKKFAFATRLGF